jgi:hypothetical protein
MIAASIVMPMVVIRAATSFYFTFFFRFLARRQNVNFELLRMALVCMPLIVIDLGFLYIRKVDLAMKQQHADREYLADQADHAYMFKNGIYLQTTPTESQAPLRYGDGYSQN